MNGDEEIQKLSRDEFLCFLLIYASNLDYIFSNTEEAYILKRFDKETFDAMNTLFNNNNDYACLKIILSHKKDYFDTDEQFEKLTSILHEIFEADGEVSRMEKNFLPFFMKMKDIDVYES